MLSFPNYMKRKIDLLRVSSKEKKNCNSLQIMKVNEIM